MACQLCCKVGEINEEREEVKSELHDITQAKRILGRVRSGRTGWFFGLGRELLGQPFHKSVSPPGVSGREHNDPPMGKPVSLGGCPCQTFPQFWPVTKVGRGFEPLSNEIVTEL